MKIGIDAKWFFNGPPSGKVVVRQLLKEILKEKNRGLSFYIFLDKKDKNSYFPYSNENVHLIYVNNYNNLISNIFILPKYSKKYRIDVVLFQNFGTFSNIKSAVYVHDLLYLDYPQFYSLKEKLYLSLIKPLAKKADIIITISKTEKERIVKHQLGGDNVHFVHHGVGENFKPFIHHDEIKIKNFKKVYNIPDQFILYLGRLNIRKNIRSLIIAMKHIDFPLVIVGGYDHKSDDLMFSIKALKLERKIFFTGFIKEEELPLAYASAKVFCFPSYAEGFGLPPLEAMASGTPVVVADRTSLPEVCEDAALYVNPDNPIDIAEKINSLLNSGEKIESMTLKGIIQSKKFTWKKSAENLINILKENYDR